MVNSKAYEELTFSDDFLFGKILSTNLELCRQVLELILSVGIKRVELAQSQKTIEIARDARGIRLDVYVNDQCGTVYNIEMQTTDQKSLPKRSRYYQGMIDLNLIERGARFSELKKSYVIFICLRDPFEDGKPLYWFENRERLTGKPLNDESHKIFLNADCQKDSPANDELRSFLEFIRNGSANTDLTRALKKQVDQAINHDEWRAEYMTLLLRDQQMRDEGHAEGLAEGRAEGRKSIISAMLKNGMTPEAVSNACSAPLDEVQNVQAELLQLA